MANDATIGYLAILVAALGFGSNYIPVKKCETGNGLAFQFFFCWAVWLVGLGVGVYRGFPSTPPLALLGGVLWSTGNLLSVPAIKLIGLGLSLLIWGISNMCVGWASSTFGILGVEKQQVSKPVLNYAGAATALLALLVYLVVKPTEPTRDASSASSRRAHRRKRMPHRLASPALRSSLLIERDEEEDDEEGVLGGMSGARGGRGFTGDGRDEHGADAFLPSVTGPLRVFLGASAALLAGLFFGASFNPSYHIMDRAAEPDSSFARYQDLQMLDFVFAHFSGIFLASSSFFLLALLLHALAGAYSRRGGKKGPSGFSPTAFRPFELYPAALLPAFLAGLVWAVAMVAWFVANQRLTSLAVTFPIITATPGLVASLWGVVVFGEIRGRRNLGVLAAAFGLTATSCGLIAASR